MVLIQGDFAPGGLLAMSGDIFGCHSSGEGVLVWGEAEEMVKHPTIFSGQPPHQEIIQHVSFESPLDSKGITPVNPKENQP